VLKWRHKICFEGLECQSVVVTSVAEILSHNHRLGEIGRDLWKAAQSTCPAQAGLPRAGCPGPCPNGF